MKALVLSSLVTLGLLATFAGSRPAVVPADREVARLQAHFDALDRQLRNADVSQLAPAQRQARAQMIGWLREYRDAGSFPRNDRFADPKPYFRDSRGVLCAMAYLIERSGRGDVVDRIARTQNNAFLPALADDAELVAWLKGAGLTLAEASRVQPVYTPPGARAEDESASNDYIATSVALSIGSLTTVAMNHGDPDRGSAWAGIILGSASVVAGAIELDSDASETQHLAEANVLVGAVALTTALLNGFYAPVTADASGFRFTPTVFPTAAVQPHVGVTFAARF